MKKGFLCILVTALMFAVFEPISKLISAEIAPVVITFIRFLIGGVCLLPLSVSTIRKRGLRLSLRDHLFMLLLGVLLICFSMVVLQYAVRESSSPALVAILFSCNPVFTILFSSILFHEKITGRKVLAIALCFAGILICSAQNLTSSAGALSVVLALISAVSFSGYTVINRMAASRLDGNVTLSFSFLYGSAVLLLFLLLTHTDPFGGVTAGNLPILLILGIGVTGLGYFAFLTAIRETSAVYASFAFFCKPILSPFAAYLINGTPFQWTVFLGLAFVMAGLYLINRKPRRAAAYSETGR